MVNRKESTRRKIKTHILEIPSQFYTFLVSRVRTQRSFSKSMTNSIIIGSTSAKNWEYRHSILINLFPNSNFQNDIEWFTHLYIFFHGNRILVRLLADHRQPIEFHQINVGPIWKIIDKLEIISEFVENSTFKNKNCFECVDYKSKSVGNNRMWQLKSTNNINSSKFNYLLEIESHLNCKLLVSKWF